MIRGRKDDAGKPPLRLLPWAALRAVARVLDFGASKYAVDNWKIVPSARERYADAALRHLAAWVDGELLDPETGESHLAHAACCILFLLWFVETKTPWPEHDESKTIRRPGR